MKMAGFVKFAVTLLLLNGWIVYADPQAEDSGQPPVAPVMPMMDPEAEGDPDSQAQQGQQQPAQAQEQQQELDEDKEDFFIVVNGVDSFQEFENLRRMIESKLPPNTVFYEKKMKRGSVTLLAKTALKGNDLKGLLHKQAVGDRQAHVSRVREDSIQVELR